MNDDNGPVPFKLQGLLAGHAGSNDYPDAFDETIDDTLRYCENRQTVWE